ncbi:MAG TPA: carboxypeptidase regulatory-like domain-containing protein [Candidatus Acidoferrales bacterium]|nr:carboxypeptidase regulatory-like domain-containing protein [Candidatus Acidoferrales bacterium]
MRLKGSVFFAALVLLCCIPTFAQDTGQLTGTVHDSSGGVLPGARVEVSNKSTGLDRSTVTNSSGDYLVAGLPQSKYDISVTAKGFKEYVAHGVVLDASQKLRVDVILEVGTVTETINVSGADVAQVETQSSEMASTITSTQISELELNGRNFSQLVTLAPGVGSAGTRGEADVGVAGSVAYNVNGGRNEYNNWELDGGSVLDSGSNASLNLYPSLDSISEVRVLTSNYGAQYGLNGSGTIEVETKSGTDHFHGDVYEYVRNDDFNANGYFNNAEGNPRPAYKRNDFGYTLGGPVYIPGHYNTDKQKTFFFWSQEWRYNRNPVTLDQGVPSDPERAGNFTDICTSPNDQTGFTDFCPSTVSAPNYTLPSIDPNGIALLASVPHANETGQAALNDPVCGAPACYKASLSVPENWREEQIRVDHNINSQERVFVRYTHDAWNITNPMGGVFGATTTFPTLPDLERGPGTSAVVHLTSTFSSKTVNEFLFSYNVDHIYFTNLPFNGTNYFQLPSSFTMTGLFPNQNPLFGGKIPGFSLADTDVLDACVPTPPQTGCSQADPYSGGFTQDPGPPPWENSSPVYSLKDTVTRIVGHHNLAFGSTYLDYQKNEPGTPDIQGLLSFNNQGNIVTSGNAVADLLSGNIASYAQTSSQPKYYNRYKIAEPFFQDDWHVTNRLTLNLGLRVSLFGTYRDISLKSFNWETAAFSAGSAPSIDYDGNATGQVSALIPQSGNPFDGLVQCGGPGGPYGPASQLGATEGSKYPGCMKGHLFNPGPRIGFAWDPWGKGKTSIRGGYGVFFEHQNGDEANSESLESTPPIACTPTQFNITGYADVGGGGAGLNGCNGVGLLFTSGITSIPTTAVWPYVQQWNVDVEHEILPATVLTVAYVGSKGTHLNLQNDLNQIVPTPASQNPYPKGQPITQNDCNTINVNWNDATESLTSVTATINGNNITSTAPGQPAVNLAVACGALDTNDVLRPYQGWGDIAYLENSANSNYNALQISLRRNTGPLVLSVAYTYSHSLDDSSDRYDNTFVNAYDLRANYATSTFDQRHLLNISYVYDFPFFKNPGLENKLLGGWELSGIVTWQTGTPFSVVPNQFGDAAGVANGVGSGAYADLVPGQSPHAVPSGTTGVGPLLFNPNAFALPTGLTFGDEGRDAFAGPSFSNFDMALFKKFAVKESAHFEFRAEGFNVFNQTEFTGVRATIDTLNFLRPAGNQPARILELALKFVF